MPNTQTPLRRASFFQKHRFALFFFAYTVLYQFLIVTRLKPWAVDRITYSYHAVDFSCGFATKLLPGTIYNALFGSHVSEFTASVYETVLLLLFFVGVAVFLEKFMLLAEKRQRNAAFFLALFYLSGAYTFAIFTDELGMLDVYWLFFSLFFFVFLEHKWLRLLIPLLYVGCIMIHYNAILNYIILYSIVLLYRVSVETSAKERRIYIAVFAVSIALTVAVSVFFVLKEKAFLVPMETFHEIQRSRGNDHFVYYDYAFYDIYRGEPYVPEGTYTGKSFVLRFLFNVFYRIKFNKRLLDHLGTAVIAAFAEAMLILLPVLYFVYRFYFARLRRKGNALRRFCTFLMMVQFPFTLVFGMLFSIDLNRWMTHTFLVFFTCFLTVLYYEQETRTYVLAKVGELARSLPAKLYFLAYATINFWPYF